MEESDTQRGDESTCIVMGRLDATSMIESFTVTKELSGKLA